jgi:hypothetical protein
MVYVLQFANASWHARDRDLRGLFAFGACRELQQHAAVMRLHFERRRHDRSDVHVRRERLVDGHLE